VRRRTHPRTRRRHPRCTIMTTTICKIVFGNDIRRMPLPKDQPFDHLLQKLQDIHPGKFEGGIAVRYKDDEGDLVTVTSNIELREAFDMSESTLRLIITAHDVEDDAKSTSSDSEFVKVSKDGQRTATVSKRDNSAELEAQVRAAEEAEAAALAKAEAERKAAEEKAEAEREAAAAEAKAEAERKAAEEKAAAERKVAEEMAAAKAEAERKAAEEKAEAERKVAEEMAAAKAKAERKAAKEKAAAKAKAERKAAEKAAAERKEKARKEKIRLKKEAAEKARLAKAKAKAAEKAKKAAEKAKKAAKKAAKHEKKNFFDSLGSSFVSDVTIPDETVVEIGSTHTKTWLIKNSGKVAWPKEVEVVKLTLKKDKKVGVADGASISLAEAKPGQEVEVSVELTVPSAPGKYRTANYSLAYNGKPFGDRFWAIVKAKKLKTIGPKAEKPKASEPKPESKADEPKAMPESKDDEPKPKPEQKTEPGPAELLKLLDAAFVRDVTIEDGTKMLPGQEIVKTWEVINTGTISWPAGIVLKQLQEKSTFGNTVENIDVKGVAPGEAVHVTFKGRAPMALGKHEARYQLALSSGETFGNQYWASIEVVRPAKKVAKKQAKAAKKALVAALDAKMLPPAEKKVSKATQLKDLIFEALNDPQMLQETAKECISDPAFVAALQKAPVAMLSMLANVNSGAAKPKAVPDVKSAKESKESTKESTKESKESTPVKPCPKKTEKPKVATRPYKYAEALEVIKGMGFKQVGPIKKLLNKKSGDVQAVLDELFSG